MPLGALGGGVDTVHISPMEGIVATIYLQILKIICVVSLSPLSRSLSVVFAHDCMCLACSEEDIWSPELDLEMGGNPAVWVLGTELTFSSKAG